MPGACIQQTARATGRGGFHVVSGHIELEMNAFLNLTNSIRPPNSVLVSEVESEVIRMKSKILGWLSLPAILLVLASSLAACNTLEGAGEDVSAAGDATAHAAEKHKNY